MKSIKKYSPIFRLRFGRILYSDPLTTTTDIYYKIDFRADELNKIKFQDGGNEKEDFDLALNKS